jgi:hypothetical protein
MNIFETDTKDLANQGATLELRDAQGKPLLWDNDTKPVTITLYGADSDVFTAASNALVNRGIRNRGKGIQVTAESALTDQIALLAKAVITWEGLQDGNGPFPFNEDNAKRLFRVAYLREQVEQFINDRGNFSKA